MNYEQTSPLIYSNSSQILVFKKARNLSIIYIYSKIYYIMGVVTGPLHFLILNKQTGVVGSALSSKISLFFHFYYKLSQKLIKSLSLLAFKKISYLGKGYRLYVKQLNIIYLQIGYSHKLYILNLCLNFKVLSRSKILILGLDWFNLVTFTLKLINLKLINIYTLKGIRFSKQPIRKKIGKVSSYR